MSGGWFLILLIAVLGFAAWMSDKEATDDWANETRPDEDFRDDCL